MSNIKIDRKIVKYHVQKPDEKPADTAADKVAEQAADKAADKAADAKLLAVSGEETFRDKNGRTAKVIRMHE